MTTRPATIFDPNVGDVPLATALENTPDTGQQLKNPVITGGTADGTSIGQTTPAPIAATTLSASGKTALSTTQISSLKTTQIAGQTTFVANGTTLVSVQVSTLTTTSLVLISLNTPGGTVGAIPAIETKNTSTGKVTVKATALDTSTYNIAILG